MTPALWLLIGKVVGVLLLAAAVTQGVTSCREGLREEGRVEVRGKWIAADNARKLKEREAQLDKQRTERAEEQRMARAAEEKNREAFRREEILLDRALAAERSADGLRGTIARLDSASRSRRAEGSCPAAEREADEAQTARGLLGACVGRYRELGQAAGELASQVTGLQDHVVVVQPEAAQLLTKDE